MTANLSDSPLTATERLGGNWRDHNLAAIFHVAACNFRCPYCYVDDRFLAGKSRFFAEAPEIVDDWETINNDRRVTILRMSGGEPLFAPGLLHDIFVELERRNHLGRCVLKAESNLTPLAFLNKNDKSAKLLSELKGAVPIHATLHVSPSHSEQWDQIEAGLTNGLELGLDIYPAIGGADWDREGLEKLLDILASLSTGLVRRLAVRPFQLRYPPIMRRRKATEISETRGSVAMWAELLQKHLSLTYMSEPRHRIEL